MPFAELSSTVISGLRALPSEARGCDRPPGLEGGVARGRSLAMPPRRFDPFGLSLTRILSMWVVTVRRLISRQAAISRLPKPP